MAAEPVASRNERAAVLYPERARDRVAIGRGAVPDELAELVDYAWWVAWSLQGTHRQQVIPRPVVHLAVEVVDGEPRALVHGIHLRMFERRLSGTGSTVALAFRPGGFRPFLRGPASALRGREVPAAEVLGVDDRAVAARALAAPPEDGAAVLAEWLADLPRERDPRVPRLAALVERVAVDRSLVRAEQLAELAGVTLRTLERQFADCVGVGPKWVLQRARLLDVAEAANSGGDVDWSALAAELGYADQSHLIRHFTALVGCPPATYAARARASGP
ncbi:AraC-like DNA-binding protein [Motilibacter rhizosphaerae]|uniref:AraC-like DNA-binding protein n=1 Tax=Motilibacter rhizosphaerae TaxID=598652 RepID=A0A4Q7NV73_9ACTN|nr:helix-turn-helix domain-containing protein [Motilibacter rhizosphaerae]RZS90312.1 AraC-like DNA-binding protein [Motilibacter rhizosphaerae]